MFNRHPRVIVVDKQVGKQKHIRNCYITLETSDLI